MLSFLVEPDEELVRTFLGKVRDIVLAVAKDTLDPPLIRAFDSQMGAKIETLIAARSYREACEELHLASQQMREIIERRMAALLSPPN